MKMIKIIDGYGFTHDRSCYALYEIGEHEGMDMKTREKTGEKKEHAYPIGYYSTVTAMANGLLNYATKKAADKANCQTIAYFVMIMGQIKDEIISALKDTAI